MSLSQRVFAAWYDVLNSGVEGRLTPFREQTAGRARGDVLEIGGGTGANLRYYPAGVRLTVAEPNPHMVKRLRRRAGEQGREVAVVPDTGETLPFPDASFDTVVTTLVLCMVSDLDRVVREARRVVRPGGAFLFYEHVVARTQRMRVLQDALNPVWRFMTTGCNLNRDIAGAVRGAGFTRVEIEEFRFPVGLVVNLPNIVGVAWA
jgi:ubiquinone/menaquinone biosynthesis C-methylase UbiE